MKKLFYFLFFLATIMLISCEKSEPGSSNSSAPGGGSASNSFSVSASKTVIFSPGNLQYHAVNDEWRFAPSQLDYIGYGNENIGPNYNGWIDMFGWGTGNNPTNTSIDVKDYSTFVDWGVNKIGNDAPNTWRTPTYKEWNYLMFERANASNLKGVAEIAGVNGIVVLPDSWQCPEGVTFKSGFDSNAKCAECYGDFQKFSKSDWSKLESSGAVFLHASDFRMGNFVSPPQLYGRYWSSTKDGPWVEGGEENSAGSYTFTLGEDLKGSALPFNYATPVRLVRD